jgi:hypothetical protein
MHEQPWNKSLREFTELFGARFAARNVRRWLPVILCTGTLGAQTCLVLSSATIKSDATAFLDLALYSVTGAKPAAIQWTFQYSSASVRGLAVDAGPALESVGKTTICAGDATVYNCLTTGTAKKTITDGIIAKVTAILAPGATKPAILVKNALGTSSTGNLIPIFSRTEPPDPHTSVSSDCTSKEKDRPGK